MKHPVAKYFGLAELVSAAVLKKYGSFAWSVFDPRLLDVLLWLREGLGIPLVCNTKQHQQRGFRENLCTIVKEKTKAGQLYLSGHTIGKAVDLSSGAMTARDIRKWIRANIDSCPHPIRLEDDKSAPTWVHIDVMNTTDCKLVEFSA